MNKEMFLPFCTLFYREYRRFFRVFFQTIASPLISVFLYLLIFGFSIGSQLREIGGVPYFVFLVPGLIVMVVIRNAFDNATGSIVTSKFVGELEDLKMVPLHPFEIALAGGLASLFRGLIVGFLTYLISALSYLFIYENVLYIEHPFLLLLFLSMGGLSWAFLGLGIALLSKNFEQVNAFSVFIFLPMIYLGGVFFSLETLPDFWQTVAMMNPLLYLVEGARYCLLGQSPISIMHSFWIVFFNLVLFFGFALYSLRKGSYHRW